MSAIEFDCSQKFQPQLNYSQDKERNVCKAYLMVSQYRYLQFATKLGMVIIMISDNYSFMIPVQAIVISPQIKIFHFPFFT